MNRFYWESANFDVSEYVNNYALCQSDRRFSPKTSFELVKPNFAWHTVSMDHIGPLLKSNNQHKYIIITIDHLIKWVESRSVFNLGAIIVAKFIMESII